MIEFDSQIPSGPLEDKWENHLEHVNLVGPRNRPTYDIIVVGTGLAGASAASSLAARRVGRFFTAAANASAAARSRTIASKPTIQQHNR